MLWSRIQRQPEDARRLLGVVAVSGRPIRQALAFQASELGAGGRVALASLRSARLIRCIGQTQQDEIETYHDRIRETVVAHLSPDALALAPRTAGAGSVDRRPGRSGGPRRSPTAGAGDFARACDYYSRGADQAAAALAFDHAARLYRIALELHQGPAAQARLLWKKLGDALANAGRGAEAAQAYLKAAESATAAETLEAQTAGLDPAPDQRPCRRRVGPLAHLARPAGHDHAPHGAAGPAVAPLASGLAPAARSRIFAIRDESQISAMDLTRIDLCWSAVAGLSMIEPIRGRRLPDPRAALLALKAGEPSRIARALAMEACHRSTCGNQPPRPSPISCSAAEDIAHELDSPYLRGMIAMVRGREPR